MGNFCIGSTSLPDQIHERMASRHIQAYIKDHEKQQEREKWLLLLGTGSSGKSTLFKELRLIDGHRFQDREKIKHKQIIRKNMLNHTLFLLAGRTKTLGLISNLFKKKKKKNQKLYEGNPQKYEDCRVDVEDKEIMTNIDVVLSFSKEDFDNEDEIDEVRLEKLGNAIEFLWTLYPIKHTLRQRTGYTDESEKVKKKKKKRKEFLSLLISSNIRKGEDRAACIYRHRYFPDNLEHFLQKAKQIMVQDYMPDNDDILRTRNETNGIEEL
ncbi:G-protein subunit alpha 1, partial [Reticulomyxa filosa]